ncbi:MAG: helicase-associated domain-containing protein, partial [Chloroflexi bacterium]|nr:helicase-associated domain-containing protein [Chloroflexota bacterium]
MPTPISPITTQPGDVSLLRRDLCALVAALQREPAALRRDGQLTKAELLRLNEGLLVREDLTGVRSEDRAGRLAFLGFLARQTGLVIEREDRLVPAEGASICFSDPVSQQVADLWQCWYAATIWDDLRHVSSLRVKQTPSHPLVVHDPAAVRRRALTVLARVLAPGAWVPLTDAVDAVSEHDPAFLRHPESARWEICDAATGRDLAPARYWDLVEGALLRFLLTGPLHWLGCISLGYDADGVLAFCALTPLGAHLLGLSETPWLPSAPEPLVIQPNFEVVAPFHADLGAVLRLERLAELVQDGPARVYRLTRDRFRAALDAGASPQALLAFLTDAGAAPLPQNVAYTLREWAGQYGRVRLELATLLRVDDEILMRELESSRRLAPLLGEALSGTTHAVAAENVEALAARLREDGYMPHVDGDPPAPTATGRLHLAQREVVPLLAAAYALLRQSSGPPRRGALR